MGPIEGKEEERANERTLEKKKRLKGEAARKSEEMLERRMEGHRACSRTVAHLQISFSPFHFLMNLFQDFTSISTEQWEMRRVRGRTVIGHRRSR